MFIVPKANVFCAKAKRQQMFSVAKAKRQQQQRDRYRYKTPTSRLEKNKKDRWAITVRKSQIEANRMLVTQAFSQDVKYLACVPLSTISGG